jgi:hypothetical protein
MHPTRNSAAFILNLSGGRVMPGVRPLVNLIPIASTYLSIAIWSGSNTLRVASSLIY